MKKMTNTAKVIKGARDSRRLSDWREDEWTEEMYKDVYDPRGRDSKLENDEVAGWEAAFMEGYDLAA